MPCSLSSSLFISISPKSLLERSGSYNLMSDAFKSKSTWATVMQELLSSLRFCGVKPWADITRRISYEIASQSLPSVPPLSTTGSGDPSSGLSEVFPLSLSPACSLPHPSLAPTLCQVNSPPTHISTMQSTQLSMFCYWSFFLGSHFPLQVVDQQLVWTNMAPSISFFLIFP